METSTSTQADLWVDLAIRVMETSYALGVRVYPTLAAFGLIKALIKYV